MNKTIKINPNLLLVKPKREKKEKTANTNATKKNVDHLKRQLLRNAKENITTEKTSLNESMNYLSKLNNRKKQSWVEVSLDNPSDLFPMKSDEKGQDQMKKEDKPVPKDEVPYGCLKKGKKPTYRSYKRMLLNETRKNNSEIVESLENVREKKLEELKKQQQTKQEELKKSPDLMEVSLDDIDANIAIKQDLELSKKIKNELAVIDELKASEEDKNKKKTLIKKIVSKKYVLGKNDEKQIVSVLIKDAERKNEIIQAKQELQRMKINKIKEYLLKHNLVKKGSEAPNTVLLDLYKNARLTGDVHNVNFNTMLETFVSEATT
jgi:hypothetical protein